MHSTLEEEFDAVLGLDLDKCQEPQGQFSGLMARPRLDVTVYYVKISMLNT